MDRIIGDIGTSHAHSIACAYYKGHTEDPIWPDMEKYFQSLNSVSRDRIKLFRLGADAAISSFSGRHQLYERYYSGDPVRLAGALYSIYDRDPYMDRISHLLDPLEQRPAGRPALCAAE